MKSIVFLVVMVDCTHQALFRRHHLEASKCLGTKFGNGVFLLWKLEPVSLAKTVFIYVMETSKVEAFGG